MKSESINSVKLEFDAISSNEAFARQAVSSFAASLDPTIEEIKDLRVIVSEAVTNCVVHAYRSRPGKIYIHALITSDRRIKIRIKDKGCGIEDIEKCMEPLYTTDQSGERGGMGFAIMQAFSDKFKVRSKVGRGTVLSFEVKFSDT